jgi:hypothetical protein
MYLDRQAGEAVVNIMPTHLVSDIGLHKRLEGDVAKIVDVHVTADGKAGALPRMIASRSYLVFYKHWGIFYDGGRETGVKVLREVLLRMRQHHRDDLQWMPCSEVARYYAAAKTYRLTQRTASDGVTATIESVFPCPCFTVSFTVPGKVRRIAVAGTTLKPAARKGKRLETQTWFQEGQTVYACFPLATSTSMTVSLE